MASLNKVQLIGNLGKDPEFHVFPNGDLSAIISLATTSKWKDRETSEPREATEWHRVVLKNRQAEIARNFLKRGAQIYVDGELRTRKFTDKDGVERYTTEVAGFTMKMLDKRHPDAGAAGPADAFADADLDDDVPF